MDPMHRMAKPVMRMLAQVGVDIKELLPCFTNRSALIKFIQSLLAMDFLGSVDEWMKTTLHIMTTCTTESGAFLRDPTTIASFAACTTGAAAIALLRKLMKERARSASASTPPAIEDLGCAAPDAAAETSAVPAAAPEASASSGENASLAACTTSAAAIALLRKLVKERARSASASTPAAIEDLGCAAPDAAAETSALPAAAPEADSSSGESAAQDTSCDGADEAQAGSTLPPEPVARKTSTKEVSESETAEGETVEGKPDAEDDAEDDYADLNAEKAAATETTALEPVKTAAAPPSSTKDEREATTNEAAMTEITAAPRAAELIETAAAPELWMKAKREENANVSEDKLMSKPEFQSLSPGEGSKKRPNPSIQNTVEGSKRKCMPSSVATTHAAAADVDLSGDSP